MGYCVSITAQAHRLMPEEQAPRAHYWLLAILLAFLASACLVYVLIATKKSPIGSYSDTASREIERLSILGQLSTGSDVNEAQKDEVVIQLESSDETQLEAKLELLNTLNSNE